MPPRTQSLSTVNWADKARAGSTLRRVQRLSGLPTAHRILGIDPGLHRTGYGVIEMRGVEASSASGAITPRSARLAPHLIEGGVLRARAGDPFPKRLQSLYDGLVDVLREHAPDAVVIEDLFSTYSHPRSAILMAHARGVLMLAAQQVEVPVHSFLPNEVKQVVAGNGHATKVQIQNAVRVRLSLNAVPNPPDVADALAIALCFAMRQSSP
ncbi:MAG: crossover junction endodeoxyribonuclease RuvC [Abditibacteriota bacterium]|nr:crossover junction endodeoxyribonuclease RuvC [Abditibacteriota bacterium]